MRQESLDLSVSLTARHRTLRMLLIAIVYNRRGGLEEAAAAIDRSPSELAKMLHAAEEHRKLDIDDFEKIIDRLGDTRPVEWLVEKYMSDPDARRTQAISQLATLLPAIAELAAQAGIVPVAVRPPKGTRR